ncbi:MAG: CDP-alcohol phosphatidyltransferase family protein [Bacteroidota bacterium]
MRAIIKCVPNFFTLLNLLAGSIAIVFSFEKKIEFGCYLIFLAVIFDFLDGFLARILNARSELGKQLDSLADLISFGLAPSVFIYHLFKLHYIKTNWSGLLNPGLVDVLFLGAGFTIVIFSALRLAKFNTDPEQKMNFKGLPTPANAIFVSSLPLIVFTYDNTIYVDIVLNVYFLVAVSIIMPVLLIINMRMFSLKMIGFAFKKNIFQFILIIASVILLIFLHFLAVPVIVLLYILLSFIKNITNKNNTIKS